jgi:N-methylhydantoinase A
MLGRRIRIGVDTGGTFTDVVAVDEDTGQIVTTKTPSTPTDPAEGFLLGVVKMLRVIDANQRVITTISHGTTVATNQLLEGRIARLGFITTDGYQFVLEIARQSVPDGYGNSYFWVKPERIVSPDLVRTVRGRLDHTGAELEPFDEIQAVAAARFFAERDIDTIGVCFLHAYANPSHELRMREVLGREYPAAVVSLSCEVLPEYREYERSVTTLVDAAVKPTIGRYVQSVTRRLAELRLSGPPIPFYVMKSNGGVLSGTEVVHQPITTVLSGPAAGVLGAALVARQAGFDRVLTCDGGGTSTDVSVVLDGEPTMTTEGRIGAFPSKIPMIDVVTVGAGGGSVAWISPDCALKVGPRSAGAVPGPMCYPAGGSEVTVTDAHVALGRIPPSLLGGEILLDVERSRCGVAELGAMVGLGLKACATGILEVSAWNQANALRQITVRRGLDVREFTLTTFGGSGSLLLCRLMDILSIGQALVPINPASLSAFGLLTVDVKNDYVRTAVARHKELDVSALAELYDGLETQAAAALDREGFAPSRQRLLRSADLRYFGQAFEVRVPVPDGPIDPATTDVVAAAFHRAHRAVYGYDFVGDERQPVEWVNVRVTGVGPIAAPRLPDLPAREKAAPSGHRPVCLDSSEWVDTESYWRPDLAAGQHLDGPAVVEDFGSTVPLHAGFRADVDTVGNLIITRSPR